MEETNTENITVWLKNNYTKGVALCVYVWTVYMIWRMPLTNIFDLPLMIGLMAFVGWLLFAAPINRWMEGLEYGV